MITYIWDALSRQVLDRTLHVRLAIKAGLPIETPAVTVNVVCGSGLNCVNMAAQMIKAGDADIVVAGGMENMSMAPYALTKG